ncbi:MAG: T9SS type A sorting domain-containing protein, partial [Flavobacteriaceae bacterium]|nr:T9SS type A sorting domain-containing protein [Flavobacteriaceae bacterium]
GDGGSISSSTGVAVNVGTGWNQVVIPISVADMVTVVSNVGPGFDVAATLANCSEFRILSNPAPSYGGEPLLATMELDNIEASTTLGTEDVFLSDSFTISPNPGSYTINIALRSVDTSSKIEVYDILGKRIFFDEIDQLNTSVNVSQWNSGVYLVKVTDGNTVQTKRFIKQ